MNDPRTLLKDAGYVVVGLGVIAVQRGQVRRRELERQLADAGQQLDLEHRIETIVTEVRDRLPAQTRDALDTAVGAAKDASGQLLDLVRPTHAA